MAKEQHTPGEHKIFGDGKERILDRTSDGLRWKAGGDQGGSSGGQQGGGQQTPTPVLEDYKPPTLINREEWLDYNQYINLENPFIYINTYEEGQQIWYARLYELQQQIEISKHEAKLKEANEYKVEGSEIELGGIEEKMRLLNKNFYAVLMYKMCIVISKIEYMDSGFDYDQFLQEKGFSWKALMDYLEEVEQQ